jgi:hypothetical protein
MILLEAGDKDTRHNVSKAHSRIGPGQVGKPEVTDPIDEFRLIPWLEWMERVDFGSR